MSIHATDGAPSEQIQDLAGRLEHVAVTIDSRESSNEMDASSLLKGPRAFVADLQNENKHSIDAVSEARAHLSKAEQGSTEQRAVALWALAVALEGRHKAYSNVADFHERAQVIENAISLLQDDDERLARWTYDLAITYNVITSKTNTTESRDLAIKHFLLVRQFIHGDDARQPYTCTWCSHLLSRRYWTSHDIKDAELAVHLVEHARSMMKREHFLARFAENTLFQALRALGYAHISIFHSREDKSMADLEDAVAAFRQNLVLRPVGADQHVRALNDLGNALGIIFKTCGDRVAGREALSIHQAAVAACPPGHRERYESLQKLGLALQYLSTHGSLKQDLSIRMSIFEEVLTLTPPGHSGRPDSLQFVAGVYKSQYFATRSGRWLNKAADALEESIRISPPGYVNRHQCLSIYASLLILRYQTFAGLEDLDKAEECAHEVIELIKPLHPALYRAYLNLAQIYLLRDAPSSMDHSIKWMSSAIQDPCADTRERLQQVVFHLPSLRDRILSFQGTDEQRQNLLKAYQQALQLIPQIAHVGLDVQTRLQDLMRTEQLAVDAAIVALICSKPEAAVECLENGRAMFWAQGLALRASFEGIPHDIAAELREISQSLEAASLSSRGSIDIGPSEDVAGMMRRKTTRYRVLLEEARKLPGMGLFLLNVGYPVLSTASKDGYIVILLADQLHSHAIAISPGGAARHIKLPNLTIEEVNGMGMFMREESMRYRSEMETACEEDETDRLMLRMKKPKSTAEITLAKLWSKIVEPVIHGLHLKKSTGRTRPRIYWIPTGAFAFLPLHAAGEYTSEAVTNCLFDFAVSSYSPSIGALLKAQAGAKVMPSTLAKVLLVAEPNAPGLSALPNTTEEVESITRILPHGVILSSQNAASTVHQSDTKDLLELLPQASILHLACHGHQDPENPLNSGFMLGNGRLTISQLMQTRTPDAFLAFLSACETAKGAQKQPDQAVHLAAAMLFAGFKSIIGTMWGMGDADGPAVATHVYRELFRGEELDPQVVPYALDEAVQALRQAGVSAHRWATFIHVGA